MAEKKDVRKQTGVRLDLEIIKALTHLAVDTGRSFTSLVQEAVEDLLKKYQKKSK
jgi:predicted DNA-binding protein